MAARVALDSGKPVAFVVLTCDDLDQALEPSAGVALPCEGRRCGRRLGAPLHGNKGTEAAMAAMEMLSLKRKVTGGRRRRARYALQALFRWTWRPLLRRRLSMGFDRTRRQDGALGGRQADSRGGLCDGLGRGGSGSKLWMLGLRPVRPTGVCLACPMSTATS